MIAYLKNGARITFICANILLAACNPFEKQNTDESVSLSVSPRSAILWEIGMTTRFNASLIGASGKPQSTDTGYAWSSSDEAVAKVDAQGVVTAVGEGKATITVIAQGQREVVSVVVATDALSFSGVVQYEDKEYSDRGFTGRTDYYKPVRHATVDLMDNAGNIVQSTTTDNRGNYAFGFYGDAQQYTVRVLAASATTFNGTIEINDLSGNLYAVTKTLDLADAQSFNLTISAASQLAGPFNMLDVFMFGSEFVASLTTSRLPALNIYWESNGKKGTFYCSQYDPMYCKRGEGIYVYNQNPYGDTDEFDDDVLWHEFSHFLVAKLSRDDSPGGCHSLTSNDLDLRLAWSEGFGDFFPAAVKTWMLDNPETAMSLSIVSDTLRASYIDTSSNYAQIAVNIDTLGGYPYLYASSEMAVADVLYGVSNRFGMKALWQVLEHAMPGARYPASLEVFWDGWIAEHQPQDTELHALQVIFNDRKVYYQRDAYEEDNSANAGRSMFVNNVETHYLYAEPAADVDVVAFDAVVGKSYELETFDLRNGIDTSLRVLSDALSVITENDDADSSAAQSYDPLCGRTRFHNNGSALASKVTFQATRSGVHFVEISGTRDHQPYAGAGRYGTYSLRVTENR